MVDKREGEDDFFWQTGKVKKNVALLRGGGLDENVG